MKTIELDDDLYALIASQTQNIGESASDILRRLLIPVEGAVIEKSTLAVSVQSAPDVAPVEIAVKADNTAVPTTPSVPAPSVANVESIPAKSNQANVFTLLADKPLQAEQSRVEHFLHMLSALHQANEPKFNQVLKVAGRNRLYFAQDKEALLASGSSTNPKQIPGSSFWVVTNNNTAKKVSMLKLAAAELGYTEAEVSKLGDIFNG